MSRKLIYESAPMKIGKLQWRVIVYETLSFYVRFDNSPGPTSAELPTRFVGYQFSDLPEAKWPVYPYWRDEKEHPNYDDHDGECAGLPKTLRKLYFNNLVAIEAAVVELAHEKVNLRFLKG